MRISHKAGAIVAWMLTTTWVGAATPAKLDLEEMVRSSDLIVEGSVVSAESQWIGRELFTRYQVQVSETLYGTPRLTVPVLVMGGIDMKHKPFPIGSAVAGAPTFVANERAVLLLNRLASREEFAVVGFNQGRFTIQGDHVQGARTADATRLARSEPADAFRAQLRALIHQFGGKRAPAAAPRRERQP